jgi:alpha-tubulin suppressor-like RCC1 family protein
MKVRGVMTTCIRTISRSAFFLAAFGCAMVRAAPLSDIVAISAGNEHTCALTTAGGVLCWGQGFEGQLGTGGTLSYSLPVPVQGLSSGVAAIAAGGSHTCALTTAGGVKCWGSNFFGELGDGSGNDRYGPVDVRGLTSGVLAISAGGTTTCALLGAGGVKCWGGNYYGELGNGTIGNDSLVPVDVIGLPTDVVAVSASEDSACALTSTGGMKCWGLNVALQLGYQTTGSYSSVPHDVDDLSSGVSSMSLGTGNHMCAVVSGGGAKCWGSGAYGMLGNGAAPLDSLAVDVVGLNASLAAIGTGDFHTCALTDAGGVKCWGANFQGQTGVGSLDTTQYHTPVDANFANDVVAIALGERHSCALTADRKVRCWGADDYGQLGNNVSHIGIGFPDPTSVGIVTAQSITFPPIHNHSVGDAPFTVAASATSGLPVTFASLTPSACTVAGSTVTIAATGVCTIAANQSGDDDYGAVTVPRSFAISTGTDPTRLVNISTRGQVLSGEDLMIAGFVVTGAPKTVVLRALGPSLASSGVRNVLANPRLDLHGDQGAISINDDWQDGGSASTIQAMGFAPGDARESAVIVTLQPGSYTAIVSGVGGATGTGLVEVYEADREDAPLINISTRGHVGTDLDVMIGGFVISGNSPQSVVVTAKGPSLANYGISNPVANPTLTLVRQSDQSIVATNDDWGSAPNASDIQASGFAPSNSLESAILATLPPGAYTAIVSGVNGDMGTGIVEVYATQ